MFRPIDLSFVDKLYYGTAKQTAYAYFVSFVSAAKNRNNVLTDPSSQFDGNSDPFPPEGCFVVDVFYCYVNVLSLCSSD